MRHLALLALAVLPLLASAARPQVLVIERRYDGNTELAGDVYAWRYSGGLMVLEFGDSGADGIFRNGFDEGGTSVLEPVPCRPVDGVGCP